MGWQRLPSGRHKLSPESVTASQRGRLLAAAVQVIGERGWSATRVADVVARAGVSRRTFYELFDGLDACFAEAIESLLDGLLDALDDAARAASGLGFEQRVRLFFDGYVGVLDATPGLARAAHLEMIRATDEIHAQHAALIRALASRMHRALRTSSRGRSVQAPPLEFFVMLIGGMDQLIRERIADGSGSLDGFAARATALVCSAVGAAVRSS